MKDRILFRFHKSFDVCCQNLRLLRLLNPDTPIDGMYGGNESLSDLPRHLTNLFDSLWSIPLEDPFYKWKHGDLCVRWWFKDVGRRHEFSHVYLIEWDMVLLKPLNEVYGELKPDCNYASIFGDYAYTKEINWTWTSQQFGLEVDWTLRDLKEQGYLVDLDKLSFAIMGGCVLSRKFLELYSNEFISSHSNDEARLSIYSAAYGVPLINSGLLKDPRNRFATSNTECNEIDLDHVLALGGNAIHPLRIVINDIEEKIRQHQERNTLL